MTTAIDMGRWCTDLLRVSNVDDLGHRARIVGRNQIP